MADLNDNWMYSLADVLGADLTYDPVKNTITAQLERHVPVGKVRFTLKPKILSSLVYSTRHAMLIHVVGNVVMLLTVSAKRIRIYLLNSATYSGTIADLNLRELHCKEHVEKVCGAALVKCWERGSQTYDTTWTELETKKRVKVLDGSRDGASSAHPR